MKFTALCLLSTIVLSACVAPLHHEAQKQPPLAHAIEPLGAAAPVVVLPQELPDEKPVLAERLFNVEVVNVPVKELLYALARDAGVQMDIHSDIQEKVSLVAKNQTLDHILEGFLAITSIRVHKRPGRWVIEPDRPYHHHYKIDYLNIQRTISVKTHIASSLISVSTGIERHAEQNNNTSSIVLQGNVENHFWVQLKGALCHVLLSTPSPWHQPSCTPTLDKAAGGDLALYPEVGLLVVYGTQRQQKEVSAFVKEVTQRAQRQVLIEATIVEVELNEGYEAGIDWSLVMQGGAQIGGQFLNNNLAVPPFAFFSRQGNYRLQSFIKALETFGHTRVLSSPRVMALNNQTAVLKVVNEEVYFTLRLKEEFNRNGVVQQRKFESQLHTVPVGLVMSVTPQIGEEGVVSLYIRPSITSIGGYKDDPAISLSATEKYVPVKSQVPVLQVREFDSMLSIPDQHIAILGGLIRDDQRLNNEGVPLLARVPYLGRLFQHQTRRIKKSELVIFLRPQIINHPGQILKHSLTPHLTEPPSLFAVSKEGLPHA